jgi:hypothetical protein
MVGTLFQNRKSYVILKNNVVPFEGTFFCSLKLVPLPQGQSAVPKTPIADHFSSFDVEPLQP